jgi:hypothetical protein
MGFAGQRIQDKPRAEITGVRRGGCLLIPPTTGTMPVTIRLPVVVLMLLVIAMTEIAGGSMRRL